MLPCLVKLSHICRQKSAYYPQVMRPAKIEFSSCVDSRQMIKLGKQCFSNLIVLINNIKIPKTPEGGSLCPQRESTVKNGVPILPIFWGKPWSTLQLYNHRSAWSKCCRRYNRSAYHKWSCNLYSEKSIGIAAGSERGINSAFRPRVTVYVQSIRRVLRIRSCHTKHE